MSSHRYVFGPAPDIAGYHLDEITGRLIGRDGGLFLDLAVYSIIAENNAGQYYPDYAFDHPLFTSGMKIYSDTKVSEFINSVTRDQAVAFRNEWNQFRDHKEKIYISYGSANKNYQTGELDFVEFGHAKDDKGQPVLNFSIAYDHNNSEPLFYEEYPGSIVDTGSGLCWRKPMVMDTNMLALSLTGGIPAKKTSGTWISAVTNS